MEGGQKKSCLTVPRAEAEQKIKARIQQGHEIIQSVMLHGAPNLALFGWAKSEGFKWSEYNLQLLETLFEDDAIAQEYKNLEQDYNKVETLKTISNSTSPDPCIRLRKLITKLESILDRLELMEEPTIPRLSQKDTTLSKKKQKAKKSKQQKAIEKIKQGNKHTKSEREGMIEVHKAFYKKRWAKITGVLSCVLLITTLLINLKTIKEWFYPPRIQPSTSKGRQLPLTNENKLSISLKEICKDIDSRPLLQQEETAKRYIGINIQEEHLKLFDIHEYPEDGTFGLTMILPHESDESYLTGRKIFCTVERDKHPQLNAAKKDIEFYVSGQIKDAGSTYIELSDVSLEFD